MHTVIIVDGKEIEIPFSTFKTAGCFVRGFNEHRRAYLQGKEYICDNAEERRGAAFAERLLKYCRRYRLALGPDELQVLEDKKSEQSLFDGF